MKKYGFVLLFLAGALLFLSPILYGHCQIPCGIYTDEMRFQMIEEHLATIEKSMQQIEELSKASPINYNQLVRWITNKEEHADYIQEIVDKYFLTQRIKPADPNDEKAYEEYVKKLAVLHQMLVYAMKTKQTTDPAHVEKLRELLSEFHDLYFSPEQKKQLEHLNALRQPEHKHNK